MRKITFIFAAIFVFASCFFAACGDIPSDSFDVTGHTFEFDEVVWTQGLEEDRLWELFKNAGIESQAELDEFIASYENTQENRFTFNKDGTFLHTAKVNGELKILDSGYYKREGLYGVNCYKEKDGEHPFIEGSAANNSSSGFDNCYFWVEIYQTYYEDMSLEFTFDVRYKLKQ